MKTLANLLKSLSLKQDRISLLGLIERKMDSSNKEVNIMMFKMGLKAFVRGGIIGGILGYLASKYFNSPNLAMGGIVLGGVADYAQNSARLIWPIYRETKR